MKLIKLSSNESSFNAINFNEEGLSIILAEGSDDSNIVGSSNGSGKTLALGLMHLCMGSSGLDDEHKKAINASASDWWFSLLFSFQNREYLIERTGNGKNLKLNNEVILVKPWREKLNKLGVFKLNERFGSLMSFRSLFVRFARYRKADCDNPEETSSQTPAVALMHSLYLLGLDSELAFAKFNTVQDLKLTQSKIKENKQEAKAQSSTAGVKLQTRLDWLNNKIIELDGNINAYRVSDDYHEIENRANLITQRLREITVELSVVNFQVKEIEKALELTPDISKSELLSFYDGMTHVFNAGVLKHFDAVERFHNALQVNRKQRYENEKQVLFINKQSLDSEREQLAGQRDTLMQSLKANRALDEHLALVTELNNMKVEQANLESRLNVDAKLEELKVFLKTGLNQQNQQSVDYLKSNPIEEASHIFSTLTQTLYPENMSGISLENNDDDGTQIRFNFEVELEASGSDGIGNAKILCFDWLNFMYGHNHAMDFLWHDNRLFAHIDPSQRALWFKYVSKELKHTKKQYIVSMNKENFNAMKQYLSDEEWSGLVEKVVVTLSNNKPETRLLGIRCGA